MKLLKIIFGIFIILSGYLLFWPVPIEPVSWDAPENKGYVGVYSSNNALSKIERIDLGEHSGPEDIAFSADGKLYTPTHDGAILAYDLKEKLFHEFANTGGRVLGLTFGDDGLLYVADAYQGLFAIDASGKANLLTDRAENDSPILYADALDITKEGVIYFSDASTKFGAKQSGGTLEGSFLELMEHGKTGRILKYDLDTQITSTVLSNLSFANGVALTKDGKHLLIVETGTYSILKMPLYEPSKVEPIISNLPGFPDNIRRNADGTFWVGLVSPRSELADNVSDAPFMRKLIMRLPAFLHPAPQRYGFLLRIDADGNVLENLQDPSGAYGLTTGALDGPDGNLYISSLTEPDLAVLRRD